MSVSSLSTGFSLQFARTPLVLGALLSAFLHTALVMAFVLTPDAHARSRTAKIDGSVDRP